MRLSRRAKKIAASAGAIAALWGASLPFAQQKASTAAQGVRDKQEVINMLLSEAKGLHAELLPANQGLARFYCRTIRNFYRLPEKDYAALAHVALDSGLPVGRVPDALALHLVGAGSSPGGIKAALEKAREGYGRELRSIAAPGSPMQYNDRKAYAQALKNFRVCDAFSTAIRDAEVLEAVRRLQKTAVAMRAGAKCRGKPASAEALFGPGLGASPLLTKLFDMPVRRPGGRFPKEIEEAVLNNERSDGVYFKLSRVHNDLLGLEGERARLRESARKWSWPLPGQLRRGVRKTLGEAGRLKAKEPKLPQFSPRRLPPKIPPRRN